MKNRWMFVFIAFIFTGLPTLAQEDEGMRTLFGNDNGRIDNGGWGAFSLGYTRVAGKDAFISGGRGGWLINHRFTLGGGGYGFMTNYNYNGHEPTADNYALAGGYGGLLIEPVIEPFRPVHLSIPILIGGGGAGVVNEQDYHGDHEYSAYAPFFVFEAGIDLEFNIVKFFRVALYGSYRYTSDLLVDYYSPDNILQFSVPTNALRGFNGGITFKFGKF